MIERIVSRGRVLPTLVVDDADAALRVCDVLAEAGIGAVEIALRTPAALTAVERAARAGLPLFVGAGTLLTTDDLHRARDAGAAFGVSPGSTEALAKAALRLDWPWLPGVATASEVIAMTAHAFGTLKLFPASLELLDALTGPFPDVAWVPTGGVNAGNAAAYLSRPQVLAVAGTWIAPRALIRERNAREIRRRAIECLRIGDEPRLS